MFILIVIAAFKQRLAALLYRCFMDALLWQKFAALSQCTIFCVGCLSDSQALLCNKKSELLQHFSSAVSFVRVASATDCCMVCWMAANC